MDRPETRLPQDRKKEIDEIVKIIKTLSPEELKELRSFLLGVEFSKKSEDGHENTEGS